MNCEQIHGLLGRFHDRELDRSHWTTVEVHLGACPACAAELGNLAEFAQLVRALPDPVPPADLWRRIALRLPKALAGRGSLAARVGHGWTRAVAAALLALVLFTIWMARRSQDFDTTRPDSAASGNALSSLALDLDSFLGHKSDAPGEEMPVEQAARAVDFRALTAAELPDGYCLEGCCLCWAECCPLVTCKYRRGGDAVLVFQCGPEHPLGYGARPAIEARVHGKPTRIVECNGRLASSWRSRGTTIGMVGPRDLSELLKLMAYVDQRLEEANP
jgi:hypothetical protein